MVVLIMTVWPRGQTFRILFCLKVLAFFIIPNAAVGQEPWEMRVCADSHNFPVSSQRQKGFDNRIAEIIASELRAELTYVWAPSGADMVRRLLWPGACDLIMGVGDGVMDLVSTVQYYQTPYVFVYRQGSKFEINSLDDEELKSLRISTYPAGAPYTALINQGLRDNIVLQSPITGPDGQDRFTPMMQALLGGEIDVVIAYGPDAGYFAKRHMREVKLVPVAPLITVTGLQMLQTLTIGVRPGDENLRDRMNVALANRWDDIQAVLEEYGVPQLPVPQPLAPTPRFADPLRIGVVLPIPTGVSAVTDAAAEAAWTGAVMADALAALDGEQAGRPLQVLFASSPNTETATRAAQRLVSTEGVDALVGGLDEAQARVLSKVAEERDVLFFNIGSPADELRKTCRPNTFHVEASAAMYLDGLTGWFANEKLYQWFFVYEDSEEGRNLYQRANKALAKSGGRAKEVGSVGVAQGYGTYQDELDLIREAAPDIVLLLLNPEEQELFLSQYALEGVEYPVTGLPFPVMQTREFLIRLRQVAPNPAAGYRAALWEASLQDNGASELNENFISRSGQPMEPTGWAAYAAVKIAFEVLVSNKAQGTTALVDFLESAAAVFDIHKGPGTSFRKWDHQLRQPLYLIKIDPEAEWGATVSERIALADLVGELPVHITSEATRRKQLDQLGNEANTSSCGF